MVGSKQETLESFKLTRKAQIDSLSKWVFRKPSKLRNFMAYKKQIRELKRGGKNFPVCREVIDKEGWFPTCFATRVGPTGMGSPQSTRTVNRLMASPIRIA